MTRDPRMVERKKPGQRKARGASSSASVNPDPASEGRTTVLIQLIKQTTQHMSRVTTKTCWRPAHISAI